MTLRLNGSTSGYIEIDAPAVSDNSTIVLPTGGGPLSKMVLETAKASTSGTSVDFTGIPSWVKRLTVVFHTLSLSGNAYGLIQLGDSGGVETTGYTSTTNFLQGTLAAGGTFSSTAGIALFNGANVNQLTGSVVFNNISSNTWVATGTWNYSNLLNTTGWTAGDKTLSGTLDRIRITSDNGTDTFDAGSINILYEG